MLPKAVEFSPRAVRQLDHIEAWYLDNAGPQVASDAVEHILDAAQRLGTLPVMYRAAARAGLREYVMEHFPYILLHRVSARKIEIVAILHQRQNR
jgi:plasmid stabilization system protein ParE